MSSQGLNEDRWLSVPGLCPLQSTVRERDIGNRHLGYLNPMVHLAREANSRTCFSLSIWGKYTPPCCLFISSIYLHCVCVCVWIRSGKGCEPS